MKNFARGLIYGLLSGVLAWALAVSLLGCAKQGTPGVQGPKGISGNDGSQGPQGQPGTIITTIEFCPSQGPTVYPSTFPEYGLCISDKLYGVYSNSGNAWLAEIVPGLYSSTATGLACTFSVAIGCQVTQQ